MSMKLVLAEDQSGVLHGERSLTSEAIFVGRDPAVCHYFFSQEQWPMVWGKHAEFRLAGGLCTVADANSRFGTFVNGERITKPVEVRVGSHVQLGAGGPILRVVSIEQSPAEVDEPKPANLGRMETVHDAGAAPHMVSAAAPKSAPPQISSDRQKAPPLPTGSAHLDLEESRTGQTRRIELNKEV